MKVDDMFPRKYATGDDLKGKHVTLVMDKVVPEKMRPGQGAPQEQKWVLYLKLATKGVILNRTLANQIAEAVGEDETGKWSGKKITLYPEPMMVAGVPRIAIRARAATNGVVEPPAELKQDDDD